MNKAFIALACVVCAGHAWEASQNQLAKLLMALEPSDGFKPSSQGGMNRRELLARAGAGLAALSAAQAANAKQGEFSGVDFASESSGSLPYRASGKPLNQNEDGGAAFGFEIAEGKPIDLGWRKDPKLALGVFETNEKVFLGIQGYINEKEWWSAGDELRTQSYALRTAMKQISKDSKSTKVSMQAYEKFWDHVDNSLGGAFRAKKPAAAQKAYDKALTLLSDWKKVAL